MKKPRNSRPRATIATHYYTDATTDINGRLVLTIRGANTKGKSECVRVAMELKEWPTLAFNVRREWEKSRVARLASIALIDSAMPQRAQS